jgi:hypothetical protein
VTASGVIAGITGHQDLADPEWVRGQLRSFVTSEKIALGLTSLARGADQIFAACLDEAEIPYSVIIPSRRYEEAFQDDEALGTYQRLRARASSTVTLPFKAPSEEAFFAAGKRIVEECTLLIAVWDGLPAKGVGGTADIVAIALEHGRRVIHVDCTKKKTAPLERA